MDRFLLLLIVLLCTGCWRKSSDSIAEPMTTFTIKSSKATNDGAPLYVVLKFTDFPQFLVDDYESIANLSATTTPNEKFLPICLIPGKTEKRIAVPPQGQSTGIYCLFTNCGEEWKHIIDSKEACKEVIITLGEHEIKAVDIN